MTVEAMLDVQRVILESCDWLTRVPCKWVQHDPCRRLKTVGRRFARRLQACCCGSGNVGIARVGPADPQAVKHAVRDHAVARKLASILHRMWVSETVLHARFGANHAAAAVEPGA